MIVPLGHTHTPLQPCNFLIKETAHVKNSIIKSCKEKVVSYDIHIACNIWRVQLLMHYELVGFILTYCLRHYVSSLVSNYIKGTYAQAFNDLSSFVHVVIIYLIAGQYEIQYNVFASLFIIIKF